MNHLRKGNARGKHASRDCTCTFQGRAYPHYCTLGLPVKVTYSQHTTPVEEHARCAIMIMHALCSIIQHHVAVSALEFKMNMLIHAIPRANLLVTNTPRLFAETCANQLEEGNNPTGV